MHSWGEGGLFTQLAESSRLPSATRAEALAEFSPCTMLSTVEPGRALWPFLSLQGGTPSEGSNKGKAVCFHLGSTAPL